MMNTHYNVDRFFHARCVRGSHLNDVYNWVEEKENPCLQCLNKRVREWSALVGRLFITPVV